MKTKRVYLIVNGILTDPGNLEGWTDRAVTAIHIHTPHKAQANEYEAWALTRRLGHAERVRVIAKRVGYYQREGFAVHFIVHSNGAFILADVLACRGRTDPGEGYSDPIESAHLFGPACDGCDIATALRRGDVGHVHIYGSKNDRALKFGRVSRALFGWIRIGGRPLGYGSLGLDCSALLQEFPEAVHDHSNHTFGHSTWFEPGHFDDSLFAVISADESLPSAFKP